tara:strand:+ start:7365 stop:7592 length:228 start_codon:yes stop_codon:yes gene_type:complete
MNWLLYVMVVITVGGEPPFESNFTIPLKTEGACHKMEEKIEADATLSWTESISVKVESRCFERTSIKEVSNTFED